MWHQWQDHKDYIGNAWSFTDEIATFIVIINLVGQCTGKKYISTRYFQNLKLKLSVVNSHNGVNLSFQIVKKWQNYPVF